MPYPFRQHSSFFDLVVRGPNARAEHSRPLENLKMDELLKQILSSVGATYLILRFGRSIMSLFRHVTREQT